MTQTAHGYAGATWAGGPSLVYDRLSEAMVAHSPVPLTGALALDMGAGTGAATRALAKAGAHLVASDLAFDMVAYDRLARPPAVVGDARALPFATGAFDVAVAAFVLNHLLDPGAAVAEAARVTRPGGAVLAAGFAAGNDHPAKKAVEEAASRRGWEVPAWYVDLKQRSEPLTSTPEALAGVARRAGLVDVSISEEAVDVGLADPAGLVAWRLGMPFLAGFAEALADDERRSLVAEAEEALGPSPEPYRPLVLVLSSTVAA